MKKIKVSTEDQGQEAHPILASLIALALVLLCLWAAQWQYQRGVDRHDRNFIISANASKAEVSFQSTDANYREFEWRLISTSGKFNPSEQILLRNRYFEGKYGFHLLTLFTNSSGRTFWVNRGWIATGSSAKAAPVVPATPTETLKIKGRLRFDESLPQGSFFALPTSKSGNLIEKWNAQAKTSIETAPFYLDLISSSVATLTPKAPVELPELSDGPHMAYALQWLFFSGLVIYGRLLLHRSAQILTSV